MNCLACDVVAGRIPRAGGVIYEDAHWVVGHSISPVRLRGWLVADPKRHVESFSELTADEGQAFGALVQAVVSAVERALGPERVYVLSFGEEVHHLHVHILPRYAEMVERGPEVWDRMWSDDNPWACSDEEAAAAAEAVRRAWR